MLFNCHSVILTLAVSWVSCPQNATEYVISTILCCCVLWSQLFHIYFSVCMFVSISFFHRSSWKSSDNLIYVYGFAQHKLNWKHSVSIFRMQSIVVFVHGFFHLRWIYDIVQLLRRSEYFYAMFVHNIVLFCIIFIRVDEKSSSEDD